MKIFTSANKRAGELAVYYDFSEKARKFVNETDPFSVYEYTDMDDNKLYAYDGCLGKEWGLTFDQMQTFLEEMQDDIEEFEKTQNDMEEAED